MTSDTLPYPASAHTAARYRLIGIGLAVAAILAFSVRPILIKLSYGMGADPITLLALRMIFSLPFFLALAVWNRRKAGGQAALTRRDWMQIVALGFMGYYLSSFLDFLGLQFVTAGIGRLLLFLYPTIVVLLSAIFLHKPVTRREIGALALTYLGVALVVSRGLEGENANLPLGAALVFAGACSYAVYLVAGGQAVARLGSLRFSAYATSVAAGFCIAQFLMLRPLSALQLPTGVYVLAFVMATLCTVLPIVMTAEALKRIGANLVALIGGLGPVSAIFLGWVGLDEALAPIQVGGAVLVLAGVMLVTVKPSRTA